MGEEVDDCYRVAGLSWGPGLVKSPSTPITCVYLFAIIIVLVHGRAVCGRKEGRGEARGLSTGNRKEIRMALA